MNPKEEEKLEKREDIEFDKNTAIFKLSHQSPTRGTLIGEFKFKTFLLPAEKLAIGRDKRAMLGEFQAYATENEKFLAFALSELKYRIVQAPPFWITDQINGNIPEEDVLLKVIDAAMYSEQYYAQTKLEERKRLLELALSNAEKAIVKSQEEQKDKKDEDELDFDLEE